MLVRSFGESLVQQEKLKERRIPKIAANTNLLNKLAENGSLNPKPPKIHKTNEP